MRTLEEILAGMTDAEREALELRFISIGRRIERCPRIILPVGPPGSGKSTWTKKYLAATDRKTVVISSDDLIEEQAAAAGVSYSDALAKADMKIIEANMSGKLRAAVVRGEDIIVDRTNVRSRARRRWMSQAPKHYLRIGLLFEVPLDVLEPRLLARAKATGKYVPLRVAAEMIETYQPPEAHEFDIIEPILQETN